ncbi:unnamed protein product [Adineta steineri]|uniref:Peptidase M13 N-terminal domain-containing protein n=1 Tax=Adineta steineri TaxID=433720 RepID=A0A819A8E6_9BILA|nr:unnamed protein product [Adineta steineri]
MANCFAWISRSRCCRRQPKQTYIYLYNPIMPTSSSSSNHCCLVCILFGFCLAIVVILASIVIYQLNSSYIDPKPGIQPIPKKRQLPDFVNINIDPCENFYEFVCDKWMQKRHIEEFIDKDDSEQKWTYIRHKIHGQLMTNITNQLISTESDHTSSIYRLYQLCETQSPVLLLDELEHYFTNLTQQEPYRSYLTLYNRTNNIYINSTLSLFLLSNPFFQILPSSSNTSTIIRINRRPLPSVISIFSNLTILNQTALKNLIQFNNDYEKFLSEEKILIKSYEQEYNQDSLIIRRILSFTNYHQCLSSLKFNTNNGLQNLIELLNDFLYSRLHDFKTQSIDKQIRVLDKITDNHTLVQDLQRIKTDLEQIEQILTLNNSNHSCIIDLLETLLDKRIKSNELLSTINLYSFNKTTDYFISNDWPFLFMLHDRLLKKTSIDTLVNFAYFDNYRKFKYPYYQPYVHHHTNDIHINHYKEESQNGYTYETNYPNLSCQIISCFDILNCYHPSLLNQLMNDHNQTSLNITKILIQNLIDRFRLLTELSDHLFPNEKNLIFNELNQIHIQIGHYSSSYNISTLNKFSSYLEYVQYLSLIPYDEQERSYYIEPIYYPLNHTLFLPFGFLSRSNKSIEYHIIKLLLKIIRSNIQSNPYHIECSLKSYDDEQDLLNIKKLLTNDESIIYLLLRTNFLSEQKIILDEYLWPFMSANSLMQRFLINYTAYNYCNNSNGYELFQNNTYFIDDIHLTFRCQQANLIKQSKCTVI